MLKYFSGFPALLMTTLLILAGCDKGENNTENHLPVAVFDIDVYRGEINTIFQFDAGKVSDYEDSAELLEVRWDWDNNGIYDTEFSTVKTISHQYTQTGLYFPVMQVRDSKGMVDLKDTTVVVVTDITNQPPAFPIYVFPYDWQKWINNDIIYFKWKCDRDPENDPLTFDLWIGTSPETLQPLIDIPAQTEIFNDEEVYVTGLSEYKPGSKFESATTYFWQIYVKDPNGNYTPGFIWRFTTSE